MFSRRSAAPLQTVSQIESALPMAFLSIWSALASFHVGWMLSCSVDRTLAHIPKLSPHVTLRFESSTLLTFSGTQEQRVAREAHTAPLGLSRYM